VPRDERSVDMGNGTVDIRYNQLILGCANHIAVLKYDC
jgi:hypothetical protein